MYNGYPDPDNSATWQNFVAAVASEGLTLRTGDMEFAAETNVLARGTPVASQILKVAHHGSNGSSSGSFLAAIQPKV